MRSPPYIAAATLALMAWIACPVARAAFPERPIILVVPTAPGGANDAMARTLGQALGARLKQPVVVENKAGANGAIATEFVKRADPDGHTLLLGYIATHAMNPALQKLRYDPVKDFAPVGMVASSATLMVANPAVKVRTATEAVAALKARPGTLAYASAGNGTAPHFAAEMFKLATETQMIHIPYKGSGPAINDTMAGQTQFMFPSLFTAVKYVTGGKLVALGVAGSKRSPLMPDVPTLQEQGIANVEVSQWYGIFAPARTPDAILATLNQALNQVLANRDLIEQFAAQGAEVETMSSGQMRLFVQQDLEKWSQVVQAAKLASD